MICMGTKSNHQEDHSTNSSEETDQQEEQDSNLCKTIGMSRSYDCVFCKRGFATAQALGGHMNIHRKERANRKNNNPPNSSSTSNMHEYYGNIPVRFKKQIRSSFHSAADHDANIVTCKTYLRSTMEMMNSHSHEDRSNPLVKEDMEKKKQFGSEEELDLELRLGHDQ